MSTNSKKDKDVNQIDVSIRGEAADQVRMMQRKLNLESATAVVRKALSLLMVSFGKEVTLADQERNETYKIEAFKKIPSPSLKSPNNDKPNETKNEE